MDIESFDFPLPPALIAQHPAEPRDAARLLHIGATLADRHVRDLPDLVEPGDVMVFNDTRVIPARLTGRRGDARIEATLHRQTSPDTWLAFVRPAKRLAAGDRIDFADGFHAAVVMKGDGGEVALRFDRAGRDLLRAIGRQGSMPLPPYIKRGRDDDPEVAARDRERYQTMFAEREGAVAAPTAGLHFTPALVDRLTERGVHMAAVTLHVGAGTFLPVRARDVTHHSMHAEWGEIRPESAAIIEEARAAGGRVLAVGTTSLRLLETAAAVDGRVHPFAGETNLFILPGFRFRAVDRLMTNFHLPKSTLFMLVAAFGGLTRLQAAYAHARDAGYRFYSYGDATLIEPERPRS